MAILTTHTGSLPRSPQVAQLLARQYRGEAVDEAVFRSAADQSMQDAVARQIASGVDIVNDGEHSKYGFQSYVLQRMSGFGGKAPPRPLNTDVQRFPGYLKLSARLRGENFIPLSAAAADGEVRYRGQSAALADCAAVDAALVKLGAAGRRRFMSAASPGIVAATLPNLFYDSLPRYLEALADALAVEYRLIIDQGFDLQIDAPDLAIDRHRLYVDLSDSAFLIALEAHIDAINRAVAALPKERIRLHVCWGNIGSPHTEDVELGTILPVIRRANVGAMGLAFANPRHAHEMKCLVENPLPDDMKLIAGVVDSTTNYVEHPELVADRLMQAVRIMGDASRVIASPDCGFETGTGFEQVAEDVVWEKLKTMSAGAALASTRLSGK